MEFLTHPAFSYAISLAILLSPFLLSNKHSPSSVTGLTATFGIFGTFLGIFAGLLAFKVSDIEGSVPTLLEGLKTAFLTSLAGISAGIIIKVYPKLYGFKQEVAENSEGSEGIIRLLSDIRDLNIKQITNQTQLLQNIEKALCGEGDTTVLTQLQKIRTSFADKQDELIKEFKVFAKTMAENNSNALIDALSQVMRDFNAKINEQFGDNFKQLNQAVEKILIWQQKYKEEIEQMIIAFDKSLQGIEQSEQNLAEINKHADHFSVVAKNLESVINGLDEQKNQVQARLQEFADISKEAKSAIPIIKEEVNKLTKEFTATVSAALAEISLTIASVKDTVAKQSSTLSESQKILSNNLDTMMRENAERITKQVTELDKMLGDELSKSLNTMSSQLASLSSQFTKDYTPLTEKLRDVVRIAKQLEN
jgi:DNA repair exonuclease SbcCD ATPase subunit